MANNNYGPPPPMMNTHPSPYYYQPQQQQHQSERISGDGEEVYGQYGYTNFIRPGPPHPMMSMVPPMPPSAAAPLTQQQGTGQGVGFGYDSIQQQQPPLPGPGPSLPPNNMGSGLLGPPPVVNNAYDQNDQYSLSLSVQSQPQPQLGSEQIQQASNNIDTAPPIVQPLQDNRSVDGEEQFLSYNNNNGGSSGPLTVNDLVPGGNPQFGPRISDESFQQYQPTEPVQNYPTFQPIINHEQRSETIGSDVSRAEQMPVVLHTQFNSVQQEEDTESGGYPSIGFQEVDNAAPRSIDGQEFPETQIKNIPIGSSNHSYSNSSSSQEPRSQTIGSEVQVENQVARSIEGQEQTQNDTGVVPQVGTTGSGHGSNASSSTANPTLPPLASQRSETLGSDTVVDDSRHTLPKSKSIKGGNHNNNSGSETGESGGRSNRGDGRRRREADSKGKGKGHRDYDRDVSRSHSRRYPSDYDEDSEDDDYDRRQHRGRRERDRDFDDTRSQKTRGGGGGVREVDNRDKSRRELDSSRDPYNRPFRRDYDFDDEYERPRSRSSYYDDEYYSARRRRRGEGDSYRPRGPPSEYNPTSRGYQRDSRPPYGYMDYPPSSGTFTVRNQFNTTAPGFDPQPTAVTSQTQSFQMYLAHFRTQNPAQYREWYHKYLAHMQDPVRIPFPAVPGYPAIGKPAQAVGGTEKLRPPSQSGRSSVVDEAIGTSLGTDDSRFRPIKENREPTPTPSRNTPLLFPTPHAIATLSPLGYIVRSRFGGPINLEIVSMKSLMKRLPEYKEIKAFPGPLIKDITHKNTIVQFCQKKIRENENQLDREHLTLLWELLILLLRQNGSAIGSDIAELLLKSKQTGQSLDSIDSDQESSYDEQDGDASKKGKAVNNNVHNYRSNDADQRCVDAFNQKLIFGHKREALEYAMDNALWGHALFFASKMDEKLYGTVLARFANETMSLNSPLQTLYHVLSGKQPPSVTCCSDESFGDWKPHLAMLLSNMGQRPEFEANAMRTLGRSLGNRKLAFAAQFCYLMAESEFGEDTDIGPLLGYNPNVRNVCEATQMTEIYEFARSLANPEFSLGSSFIESKYNYTKELINLGFVQEAYAYCEEMTKSLRKHRIHDKEQLLAKNILYLAERLVNCDVSRGSGEPTWLEELRKMADQLESETTSRKLSLATSTSDHIDDSSSQIHINQNVQHDGSSYSQPVPSVPTSNVVPTSGFVPDSSNEWHQQPPVQGYPSMTPYEQMNSQTTDVTNFRQHAPNFQIGNGPLHSSSDNNNYWPPQELSSKFNPAHGDHGFSGNTNNIKNNHTLTPQHSFNEEQYRQTSKPLPQPNKPSEKKPSDIPTKSQQTKKKGWLSGIFGSIIKDKNAMILPDDKNPTIVWDEATKTWKNTKGDDDEDSAPKGPPPTDSDLMGLGATPSYPHQNTITSNQMTMSQPNTQQPQPLNNNGLPPNQSNAKPVQNHPTMNGVPAGLGAVQPPASGPNKFQRPKGLKRNNYVDVFNANSNAQQKAEAPSVPLSATAPGTGMPNIFMPPPVPVDSGPTSFLSAAEDGNYEEGTEAQQGAAPPMFNPAQFQNQNVANYGLNR